MTPVAASWSTYGKLLVGFCTGIAIAAITPQTLAQGTLYYAGRATNGEPVMIELASLSAIAPQQVNFVYALGNQRIESQAQCFSDSTPNFWTTLDDGVVRSPQSAATQNMLSLVCSYADPTTRASNPQTALVFDPPSNVRDAPNGNILCSVGAPSTINIYGNNGSWYYTDACGETGVIDISQIQL